MDNGQRCIHCPTPDTLRCAGLDVRRFCELIDPPGQHYHPGYLEVIIRQARKAVEHTDARLASYSNQGVDEPITDRAQSVGIATDCCGGGMPPGIFDDPPIEPVPLAVELLHTTSQVPPSGGGTEGAPASNKKKR